MGEEEAEITYQQVIFQNIALVIAQGILLIHWHQGAWPGRGSVIGKIRARSTGLFNTLDIARIWGDVLHLNVRESHLWGANR